MNTFTLTENEENLMTITNFDKTLYYEILTNASNHYNTDRNTNIDHHTITGFMDIREKINHLYSIIDRINK